MPEPHIPDGYRLLAVDAVASTNDEAKQLGMDGAPARTVVWARSQTSGRGRRGRTWVSPPGNLFTSVLLRPQCAPVVAAQVSFVASLAIFDMVTKALGEADKVLCKWPNDVLVDGRKISGILLESASGTSPTGASVIDWLVLGGGVNVEHHPDIQGPQGSTSLLAAGALDYDLNTTLSDYLAALDIWLEVWETKGFALIREAWLARTFALGYSIQANLPRESLHGTFSGIDDDGALILMLHNGDRRLITAGDVFFGQEGDSNAAGN
mgnify:CR=1 FL=1